MDWMAIAFPVSPVLGSTVFPPYPARTRRGKPPLLTQRFRAGLPLFRACGALSVARSAIASNPDKIMKIKKEAAFFCGLFNQSSQSTKVNQQSQVVQTVLLALLRGRSGQ
jgi:hypothetical protein